MSLQAACRNKPDAKAALCPIKRTLASWSYGRYLIILRMIPQYQISIGKACIIFQFLRATSVK